MGNFFGSLIGITATLAVFLGWLTHIFVCLQDGLYGFLIAGALFFPIGIIHGWGIWFDFW